LCVFPKGFDIRLASDWKTYKRERALREMNLDTLYGVVIALLANLIHHYLVGSPGKGIPVPRSKKAT
jgi:hypothetical protein